MHMKGNIQMIKSEFDKLFEKTTQRLDASCWDGFRKQGTKTIKKNGKKKRVNNCVKENSIRRMTQAPAADRIRLSDDIKNKMLDHGMKMMTQRGSGSNDVIAELGEMTRMNSKFSDNAKQAIFDYLGGEFYNDLERRMDEEDNHMTLNDYMRGESVNEKNATCTGPTKKASSTSKGKKYMKCVKSGDGYKRIHWGQKGAKASSGNSKRKKAFRARHKCSSAKSNTPRGQACKDW